MRNRALVSLVVLLLAACGGGEDGSGLAPPDRIDMDAVLDAFVASSGVPGASMLVVKDGAIVYSHGSGFADDARTKAPTQATLYKTSSIAKLVIAVAFMQQVERGLIGLDDDVNDHLAFPVRNPNFPSTVITPRMLLKHGAGMALPGFGEVDDQLFIGYDPSTIVYLEPLIEQVLTPGTAEYLDTIWLPGDPGSVNTNSNISMVLLAHLVERLSGQHFIDYAKAEIFVPLGMLGTSHHYPDLDPAEIAPLYVGGVLTTQRASWFYPIGGLFTSTGDWSRFMLAILAGGELDGNRILESASVTQMLTMTTPANNQLAYGSNIGLIWREAAVNPGWYGHTGAGSQMTHVTELDPVLGIGYVLFVNQGMQDALVGPGSTLNLTIHQFLLEL